MGSETCSTEPDIQGYVLEVSRHARGNVLSVPWETAENPEAPALFPYGGFGSLLVSGERSRDGQTFFARRIVAFLPQLRRWRFRVALRRCDFYDDRVVCRRRASQDRVLARSSRHRVAGDAADADGDGLVKPRPAVGQQTN